MTTTTQTRMAPVWTEREFLDRLWRRYGLARGLGDAPRYLVAEHPRTAMGDRGNSRVLDLIVLDLIVLDRQRVYGDWNYMATQDLADDPTPRAADGTPLASNPVLGFEVKVSRGDWLRELRDPSKAEAWRRHCTEFYVVAPRDVVRPDELPDGWGLMVDRGRGLAVATKPRINPHPDPMPQPVVAALMLAAIRTDRHHHN